MIVGTTAEPMTTFTRTEELHLVDEALRSVAGLSGDN